MDGISVIICENCGETFQTDMTWTITLRGPTEQFVEGTMRVVLCSLPCAMVWMHAVSSGFSNDPEMTDLFDLAYDQARKHARTMPN